MLKACGYGISIFPCGSSDLVAGFAERLKSLGEPLSPCSVAKLLQLNAPETPKLRAVSLNPKLTENAGVRIICPAADDAMQTFGLILCLGYNTEFPLFQHCDEGSFLPCRMQTSPTLHSTESLLLDKSPGYCRERHRADAQCPLRWHLGLSGFGGRCWGLG